ncbi:MAG: hypothetical protein FJ104_04440 [Deltaproteobacteria bacterium]|nr:hypothetical protein [Deltaproteobacteria bacterium]
MDQEDVRDARGSAASPLTDAELAAKALGCLGPALGALGAGRVVDLTLAAGPLDLPQLLATLGAGAAPPPGAVPGQPVGA